MLVIFRLAYRQYKKHKKTTFLLSITNNRHKKVSGPNVFFSFDKQKTRAKDVARNQIQNHFSYVELNPDENSVVLDSIRNILEAFPSQVQEKNFQIQHYKKIQNTLCSFDISYIYIDKLTKSLEEITV